MPSSAAFAFISLPRSASSPPQWLGQRQRRIVAGAQQQSVQQRPPPSPVSPAFRYMEEPSAMWLLASL